MKKPVILVFALLCLLSTKAFSKEDKIPKSMMEGTLNVQCTPDIYDLTQEWVSDFHKQYPKILVEAHIISNEASLNASQNENVLTLTSGNYQNLRNKGLKHYIAGRQVIVPIISSKNPILDNIMHAGISAEQLGQLLSGSGAHFERTLTINNQSVKINYYALNNDFINQKVADFTDSKREELNAIAIENAGDLLRKIKDDPNGFGFCMLTDIMEHKSQNFAAGIKILPIDKNKNSKIDYMEQIYSDPNTFIRGVWIGKYPAKLTSNLFVQTTSINNSTSQKAFLNWILVEGQKSLSKYGYQELGNIEIASTLNKLNEAHTEKLMSPIHQSNFKSIAVFIAILLLFVLLIDFALFRYNRINSRKTGVYNHKNIFNENSIDAPLGLLFDKSHTWAFMEKNGQVKIGMSDFIPSITGTLTGVVLKQSGDTIKKGETLLSIIQQGKQLNIKAPVSGTIKMLNEKLLHDASIINFSPYKEGWVYAIEPSNWSRDVQFLLMFDAFKSWLKSEYFRFKDFLATIKTSEGSLQAAMVLQDGGELKKSILKDLDPKVWEDFQQHFIE